MFGVEDYFKEREVGELQLEKYNICKLPFPSTKSLYVKSLSRGGTSHTLFEIEVQKR